MTPRVLAKPDFLQAKQRVEAWWAGSSLGRPAVLATVPRPDAPPPPVDDRPPAEKEMDPQYHLAQAQWWLAAHEFPAETMPGVFPTFAHNLMIPAVFAGAELEYRCETTWMKRMPDIYDRELPGFDRGHPVFQALDAAMRLLLEHVGETGLVSCPVLLDGMTTLSDLRTQESLCLDLIDRPQDVRRTAGRLNDILLEAHAAFYSTLAERGWRHSVTWCGIYAPGRAEMVQCDFGIMLSPAMYEQFVLPDLRRMTEYFEFSCYHLDGTPQIRFLDLLTSLPRLNAIQWNPEPPAPPPLAWLEFFREVRRRQRSLWIACDAETAVELTRQLGPDGLMLWIREPKTARDVRDLLERLEQAAKRSRLPSRKSAE